MPDTTMPTPDELAAEADRIAAWADDHGMAAVRDLTPTAVMFRRLVPILQRGVAMSVNADEVMKLVEEYGRHCNWHPPSRESEDWQRKRGLLREQIRAALSPPPWHPATETIVPPEGGGWYWLEFAWESEMMAGKPNSVDAVNVKVSMGDGKWCGMPFVRWSGPFFPPEVPHG